MCRFRMSRSTLLWSGLLITLCTLTLLMPLTLHPSRSPAEYSAGGGPPGTAARAGPPGSFTHRLRSSWTLLRSMARERRDALLSELKHSRIATRLRGGEAGAEGEEVGGQGAHAGVSTPLQPVHGLSKMGRQSLLLASVPAPGAATEQDDSESSLDRRIANAAATLPPHIKQLLPTPSQCARLVSEHVAGHPAPSSATSLLPAPATPAEVMRLPPPLGVDSPMYGLVVATRFWAVNPGDLVPLRAFIERSLSHASRVLLALNVDADRADTMGFVAGLGVPVDRLLVVPVTPWIGVSPALNALALTASSRFNATRLLYQSVEVGLSTEQVRALVHEFDARDDNLLVGAVLDGHHFEENRVDDDEGEEADDADDELDDDHALPSPSLSRSRSRSHLIDGHNAPWNTAALWFLPSLLQTGFLTVSDGFPREVHQFGQEEVPTMNMLQALARASKATAGRKGRGGGADASSALADPFPELHRSRITLLHVGEVAWSRSFASGAASSQAQRKAWHERKMRSKLSRAVHHMAVLGAGLPSGRVVHRIARVHREVLEQEEEEDEGDEEMDVAGTESLSPPQQRGAPATLVSHAASTSLRPASTVRGTALRPSAAGGAASLAAAPAMAGLATPSERSSLPVTDASEARSTPSSPPSSPPSPPRVPRASRPPATAAGAPGASATPRVSTSPHAHADDELMQVKVRRGIPIGRH